MRDMKLKINEEILHKIIAAAYKDAGLIDRLKIYFLANKYVEVKKNFTEYRNTAEKIKNIPLDECPDSIIEPLRLKPVKEKKFFTLKPAYALAVSLVVVTILTAVLIFQNNEEKPVYTKGEIELAEEQVKASLVIVNKIFKKTENLIQEEVLPKRVGKPIHKSLTIINDVLLGG